MVSHLPIDDQNLARSPSVSAQNSLMPFWFTSFTGTTVLRQSVNRKRFLPVATMVKNQRRWLREWIEFHHMMGVDHFIIYDNNSTDLTIEVVQVYIDRGLVEWIPWPPETLPPPLKSKTKNGGLACNVVPRFSRYMFE